MTDFLLHGDQPEGFVDVQILIPHIRVELAYYSGDNFVGERIDGYQANRAYLSRQAALALTHVHNALEEFGLGLKIFDAYRPQRAAAHFLRWSETPDDSHRARFYPQLEKAQLFSEGYIATHSSHSRGSTVDLTLVDLASGAELDMGTEFDFFSLRSWPTSLDVSAQQRSNRMLLQRVMTDQGFTIMPNEWWHFTLADEPWPDTCFDFVIA